MDGYKRLVALVSLWGAAGIAPAAPTAGAGAAAAPSLCTQLVTQLRRSPAMVARDAAQPGRWLQPWVVFARKRPAKAEGVYPELVSIWRKEGGVQPPTTLEMLHDAGIIRVSWNSGAGVGHCSHPMFFQLRHGAPPLVLGLPPLDFTPCLDRGQLGRLATVLGRPAYVESETLDHTRMDSLLLISPWQRRDWGRPCPVAIRFGHQLTVRQRYCGPDRAVCVAAGEIATALGRRYYAYLINSVSALTEGTATPRVTFGDTLNEQAWTEINRARRIGTPKALAAVIGAAPPWLGEFDLRSVEYFPLQLNGKAYLGAISQTSYGSVSLFGVYGSPHAGSKQLLPIAVFRMRWQQRDVKSIQARAHRVPPAPLQAFHIL